MTTIIKEAILRTRREPEVLQEGIDPREKIETTKDTIEENKALIEESRLQKEGVEGTIAQTEEGKKVRETIP